MASLTKGRGNVFVHTHTEGVYVYPGGFGVEQNLCVLSYHQAADNGLVSERRKMVWSAHQVVPECGMPLVEMVPGLHRWTPQLQGVPQGCPPAGLSVEAAPRTFWTDAMLILSVREAEEQAPVPPFQKAGGFFHSRLSDRKPGVVSF